jgi:hypothetical protein
MRGREESDRGKTGKKGGTMESVSGGRREKKQRNIKAE